MPPGTVTRLVRRVDTNGEPHEMAILTTYRRHHQTVEDLDDFVVEGPGTSLHSILSNIPY